MELGRSRVERYENSTKYSYSWDIHLKNKSYHRMKKREAVLSIASKNTSSRKQYSIIDFHGEIEEDDFLTLEITGGAIDFDEEVSMDDAIDHPSSNSLLQSVSEYYDTDLISNVNEDDMIEAVEKTPVVSLTGSLRKSFHKYGSMSKRTDPTNNKRSNHRIRLQDVEYLRGKNSESRIILHYTKISKKLHLHFTSTDENNDFVAALNRLKFAIEERAKKYLRAHSLCDNPKFPKFYMLELISAYGLKAASRRETSSDPYCVVMIKEKIHRTKFIGESLSPVWTFSTGAITMFEATYLDLSIYGLSFEIFDYKRVVSGVSLGKANISIDTFLTKTNQRFELDLVTNTVEDTRQGKLIIKFREATEDDKNFLEDGKKFFDSTAECNGLEPPERCGNPTTLKTHFSPNLRHTMRNSTGKLMHRISPYPDPNRVKKTTWMTEEDIEKESLQPSHKWVQSGAGDLGYLFVEVIGCDNLKQHTLDVDKIDPYVLFVYEDTRVCTEVVYNSASPRYMPWTRRAFLFNITYTTSVLYLSVNDYNQSQHDDKVGRLTVNLNKFHPGTEYVLYYKLHRSARFHPRKYAGVIKLRISVEWTNVRKVFLNVIEPSYRFHANVDTPNNMQCAKFAVGGSPYMEGYSTNALESYIEELLGYANNLLEVPESIWHTICWKSSHTFYIYKNFHIPVPLRSIILFLGAILFVERPQYIPSLLIASIGWIMLIRLDTRRAQHSVVLKPKTYSDFIRSFILGRFPPDLIEPEFQSDLGSTERGHINEMKVKEATDAQMKRLEDRFKHLIELNELNGEEFIFENFTTEQTNLSLSPIKLILWPWQQCLKMICGQIRYIQRIINWDRCYVSFWITSISFLSAILFAFIPWSFLFLWTCRVFVWTFFGPLMRLVDKYMTSHFSMYSLVEGRRKEVHLNREKALKLKDYKKFLFGKYILSMPHFLHPDRYVDEPLPKSSAKPFPSGKVMSKSVYVQTHILGGKLNVDMIPYSYYIDREIQDGKSAFVSSRRMIMSDRKLTTHGVI